MFSHTINFINVIHSYGPSTQVLQVLEQFYGPQCDLFRYGPGFYGALFASLAGALLLLIIIVIAVVVKKRHMGVWWVMMLKCIFQYSNVQMVNKFCLLLPATKHFFVKLMELSLF